MKKESWNIDLTDPKLRALKIRIPPDRRHITKAVEIQGPAN